MTEKFAGFDQFRVGRLAATLKLAKRTTITREMRVLAGSRLPSHPDFKLDVRPLRFHMNPTVVRHHISRDVTRIACDNHAP
jgi:hypothetical protein